MTDLIAFLTARLDEDEAAAKAAWGVEWDWRYVAQPFGERPSIAHTVHIARHDPARILREVEAKRAIVGIYAGTLALVEHPLVIKEGQFAGKINARDYLDAKRELAVLKPAVEALAAVYRDHPDYRQEWGNG